MGIPHKKRKCLAPSLVRHDIPGPTLEKSRTIPVAIPGQRHLLDATVNKTLKFFSNRNITNTVEEVVITKITPDDNVAPVNNSQVEAPKVTSPISGDTASLTEAVNGVKRVKAIMPKLSAATDPFFLDMDSTLSSLQPVTSGVQSLRERYIILLSYQNYFAMNFFYMYVYFVHL